VLNLAWARFVSTTRDYQAVSADRMRGYFGAHLLCASTGCKPHRGYPRMPFPVCRTRAGDESEYERICAEARGEEWRGDEDGMGWDEGL
jgi:hypothetical protein